MVQTDPIYVKLKPILKLMCTVHCRIFSVTIQKKTDSRANMFHVNYRRLSRLDLKEMYQQPHYCLNYLLETECKINYNKIPFRINEW